jgi:hypothetical protein
MSKHRCAWDTDLLERTMDQLRLRLRRPDRSARARTMPEAGTVESNDAIFSRGHVEDAARFKILNHGAVAVEENDRLAGTALKIVKPDAVDFDKLADRWIVTLSLTREIPVHQRRNGESGDRPDCDGASGHMFGDWGGE